jgi:TolA-binding protein/peroxiredoxin
MKKTGWGERKPENGWTRMISLGSVLLGLSWIAFLSGAVPGCKGSSPDGSPLRKQQISLTEYWDSLFAGHPESQEEFKRIQADFQTGKHWVAIGELQELLKRSPDAPWAEAVEFTLSQAWMLIRKYEDALRQLDLFLDRYPESPALPRVLISKGQVYLAKGKGGASSQALDAAGEPYLLRAREILEQVPKRYPKDRVLAAEALYSLGDVYASLNEPARADEAFRKVAEAYADTPYAGKALYALAGVLLSESDVEGAERVFGEIVERYPKTQLAGKASQKLQGVRLVGSEAPPLQIKEWIGEPPAEGNPFKDKLTLLSYWAVWCDHCKRNIPRMESLLKTYATRGVSVVGITRETEGQGAEVIREFVRTHPMHYPTGVDDDGKTSLATAVQSIPCVVAVDSDGRIRWHGHPDYLSEKVIESLLKPVP